MILTPIYSDRTRKVHLIQIDFENFHRNLTIQCYNVVHSVQNNNHFRMTKEMIPLKNVSQHVAGHTMAKSIMFLFPILRNWGWFERTFDFDSNTAIGTCLVFYQSNACIYYGWTEARLWNRKSAFSRLFFFSLQFFRLKYYIWYFMTFKSCEHFTTRFIV